MGGADTLADQNKGGAHSGSDDCGSARVRERGVRYVKAADGGAKQFVGRDRGPSHQFSAAMPQLLTFWL